MFRSWLCFLILCSLFNTVLFFPKFHGLEKEQSNRVGLDIGVSREISAKVVPHTLVECILLRIAHVMDDLLSSWLPNPYVHLYRLNRNSISFLQKFIVKIVALPQIVLTDQAHPHPYPVDVAFLPHYYDFLFRLTPF